ncbi:MAG: bis(5'-nucleosyl)-tetraphosphatase (symmetrical) YqeK [Clostridia bacterium]|nr:bis(5'-nucleosyl)-tetraphosphatase (symmetrical) YqeK [Clostridia bacterium]
MEKTLRGELSEYRMNHILGVVEEAALLAEIHGEDPEKARLAALLHDCTKEFDEKLQLQTFEKYDIIIDEELMACPQVHHAFTGYLRAVHEFGAPEDVAGAVKYHATGRAGMTRLEMILYVADLTERRRPFADKLTALREASYRCLEEACAMEALATITREEGRGRYIHHLTRETYETYKPYLNRMGEGI